jgi:predicted nucleic acid-binding protein
VIHGIDTGFLVAAEIIEHAEYKAVRRTMASLRAAGDQIAIAPQVLAEFIHVATDPQRFAKPLDMNIAIHVGHQWWTARDIVQVFPDGPAINQFLAWIQQFSLGRKRILDTLLAATYHQAGIHSLLTTNPADFKVFGIFTFLTLQSNSG